MEEERAATPGGENEAPQGEPQNAAPRSPVERRDFIRRSAEVAAASLFGLGGLDPVINRVLARVGEMRGVDRLVGSIASHLAESGVLRLESRASAATADCPSGFGASNPQQEAQLCEPEPFLCLPGPPDYFECGPGMFGELCPLGALYNCPQTLQPPFACNANTMPAFAGCKYPSFKCEWGEQFYCQVDNEHFDCDKVEGQNTGFSCPPWAGDPLVAWFDCRSGTTPAFHCDYPDDFDCGGGPEAYVCPGPNQYQPVCEGTVWDPWECTVPSGQFAPYCGTQDHRCGATEDFGCRDKATAWFSCLAPGAQFICGGPQQKFSCDDAGIYDFVCTAHFICAGDGERAFDCTSNHLFHCYTYSFECGGGTFKCSAGGNRCNEDHTGVYSHDQVGDFDCAGGGEGAEFKCLQAFNCGAADDFKCGWGTRSTCTGRFAECTPGPGGKFECNSSFTCERDGGGTPFNCGQAGHNCVSDGRQFSSDDE
jgi:hypothetical protein